MRRRNFLKGIAAVDYLRRVSPEEEIERPGDYDSQPVAPTTAKSALDTST